MNRARSMLAQLLEMEPGAIALVFLKSVFRKDGGRPVHESVTVDLGDHAGGGDGEADGITFHDGFLGNREIRDRPAVDERRSGRFRQSREGEAHGVVVGPLQAHPIDLGGLDGHPMKANCRVMDETIEDPLALVCSEFLGVIQAGEPEAGREDDGGGHERTRPRTASGFVDAGNVFVAADPESVFPNETGHGTEESRGRISP